MPKAPPFLPLLLLTACAPPAELPTPRQIAEPDPSEVQHVVFLVGDAGEALPTHYPILPRLKADVEWWAERLPERSLTVLYLGDIVYPLGLHDPGSEEFPEDSAVVQSQVDVVGGPFAEEDDAWAYFLIGNHDWGLEEEWEGLRRLVNLDEFLNRARARTGANVRMTPDAGTGGPFVLDVGDDLRFLLLDTAWWIYHREDEAGPDHQRMLQGIEDAMAGAEGREVVLAAHHPFRSAGPHGGEFDFWETFGMRYLLARSGAILQDVTSIPYRELEQRLREIFARQGRPLAFVGGHEHSLQVFEAVEPDEPQFSIVSGSASKLTRISGKPGMTFGESAPGYMKMVLGKDGSIRLYVVAAPREFKSCPKADPERAECMARGIAAFRTVHGQRLK